MIKTLLLLFSFLVPISAEATIARVQSKAASTGATNATTLAITMDATPTPGNIVIVVAHADGAAANFPPIRMSEQTGITWTSLNRTGGGTQFIAIGRVFSDVASATLTITSQSVTNYPIAAVAVEYSGSNIRVDKLTQATGSSTTPASGPTDTTTDANELWVGAITTKSTGTYTYSAPTNSFSIVAQTGTTNGTSNNDCTVAFLERIVTSTGTANAGATQTTNVWCASAVTFQEVVTAAATSPTRIPSIGG